ncbi:MAG: alpha/beta hydrolase [Thalassobaculaceae bacterium]|nr:alpha/beta hydrolase [Thalassobaculaceae bacterium]
MTILAKLAIIAGLFYLALCAVLFMFQRRLLYAPDTRYVPPAETGLEQVEVVETRTKDGLTLTGWWLEAAEDRPILLYFQGNGGSIAGRAGKAEIMRAEGYSVLLAGYRGYGGNPGRPSETGLIADGRAWLDFLTDRGVRLGRIVLYGESLGSGVAVALAVERDMGAVVLEAPFTSIRAIAENRYWYVPVRWLLRDPFDSLARIRGVRVPVLILHGDADTLIPLSHGERLLGSANPPKHLEVVQGATHTTLVEVGAFAAVDRFLTEHGIAQSFR